MPKSSRSGKIELGIALQNYVSPGEALSFKRLLKVAEKAESLGFDSLWAWDHILLGSRKVFPIYDSLTVLAAVATVTRRVKIGTGVLVLPLRNPVVLAKQIATLDNLSGGRVILGVAAGWYRREFEACGVPFESRGKIVDTSVEILRRLWTEDGVSGAFGPYHLKNVTMEPKPLQKPMPPILMGGYVERVLERIGRVADGWISYFYTPHSFEKSWAKIARAAKSAGREPSALTNVNILPARIASSREDGMKVVWEFVSRYCDLPPWSEATINSAVVGSAEECARRILEYEEAGVKHIVLMPTLSFQEDLETQMERLAEEVMPQLGG